MKRIKILSAILVGMGISFFAKINPTNAQETGRVFWESADKCTYGCYQPGGDCKSANPWEQTDC